MSETFTEPQITELGSRRLWIQLLRSRLLEEASAGFEPEADEVANAWASFCKRNQLDPENPAKVPSEFMGCPPALLQSVVEREVRIAKWKKALFEPQAAEHFERRKPALDRVVYSLLRVKEAGLARELWFRIKEGEATFAELAPDYASGNEVYTAGIVGPVTFGAMHPALAGVLKSARAGELLKPFAVAEWFLVARVDHQLPAEFDEAMKQQMIEELAAQWLQERTHGRPTA
jgi:parvulin-like peptidyl-prolyl isomerase